MFKDVAQFTVLMGVLQILCHLQKGVDGTWRVMAERKAGEETYYMVIAHNTMECEPFAALLGLELA